MSDTGFSKGPWKIEPGDPPCIVSYDGETVVDLPMWIPEFRAERDANANLIASAPELYEVLQQIVSMQPRTDVQRHWFAKGADVLAKARGEQSVMGRAG